MFCQILCKHRAKILFWLQTDEVAQSVKAEKPETWVTAAQVAAYQSAKQEMEEADERENDGQMDAFDDGQQTGVTTQFVPELMERSQPLFSLGHEVNIVLEGAESHGIVDVGDGDMLGLQGLSKEHVFIAIIAETLVEGVGDHEFSPDVEVGSMEVAIRISSPHLRRVLMFRSFLVEIAQVALEPFLLSTDADTTIGDIDFSGLHIFIYIVRSHDSHVAVDEEQPVVTGLTGQEITDGCSSGILLALDVSAMGQLVDSPIFRDGVHIC